MGKREGGKRNNGAETRVLGLIPQLVVGGEYTCERCGANMSVAEAPRAYNTSVLEEKLEEMWRNEQSQESFFSSKYIHSANKNTA